MTSLRLESKTESDVRISSAANACGVDADCLRCYTHVLKKVYVKFKRHWCAKFGTRNLPARS
eukprot:927618-Pelagomonas_calceolata.AAC.1